MAVDPMPSLNSDPPAAPHTPRLGEGSQSHSCFSATKAGAFPRKQEGQPRAACGTQARQQEIFPPEDCWEAHGGLSLRGRLHSPQ